MSTQSEAAPESSTQSEAHSKRPRKPFQEALSDFMSMAKGCPQVRIAHYFLEQIITHSDLCDQGSILVYNPPASRNDGTIGRLKLLDKAWNVHGSIGEFPGSDFGTNEGVAGLAFRKRAPEFAPDTRKHPQFKEVPDQDIAKLYCVPILLDDRGDPFGVVSFHNTSKGEKITPAKRVCMDVAVKALEAMLALSPPSQRLVPQKKVFIVHGHNEDLREDLRKILKGEGIEAVVIQSLARTGQDLLSFVEDLIRDCVAGFVILTPDDEGRLYQFGEPMRQRARQNVIFEGGYLTALFRGTNRVCFLQQGDIEIPSDLNGLLMERFESTIDKERIRVTLQEWGLQHAEEKTENAARASGEASAEGTAEKPTSTPATGAAAPRLHLASSAADRDHKNG